jgi:hypothetical protein
MKPKYYLALSLAILGLGCDDYMCTASIEPAIRVEIRDSVTNAVAAAGSSVVATDGVFTDSMAVPVDAIVGVAHERPGNYTVRVHKPGYRTWSRSGVLVEDAQCHVATVDLLARLQRS